MLLLPENKSLDSRLSGRPATMLRLSDVSRLYQILAICTAALVSAYVLGVGPWRTQQPPWHGDVESILRTPVGSASTYINDLRSTLNETLGFQKILVINLPRASDNRDRASLAASLTGLKLEYVDGVTGFDMGALPVRPEDLVYQGPNGGGFANKTYYSWRAHVRAIRTIVEQNLTTALILEDDADFDIQIKKQMMNFARASTMLLQPIDGSDDVSLDPTNPRESIGDEPYEIDIDHPDHQVTKPTSSPFGDTHRWDVLWLGHCGVSPADSGALEHPLGRVAMHDDTAIQTQHYFPGFGDHTVWPSYPNNTRLVFHARGPVCNLAYGLSLQGAKRLLFQIGIQNMTGTTDTMLRHACDGNSIKDSELRYTKRTCLSVLPPLFGHHFPKAYPRAYTENVRFGTRANFDKLIDAQTDYHDAFPDEEPMALYFHHQDKYDEFLRDPEGIRRQREDGRGVVQAQRQAKEERKESEKKMKKERRRGTP